MGPRPEERASVGDEDNEEDIEVVHHAQEHALHAGNPETEPEMIDSTEAWAVAEGYTPLEDLSGTAETGFNSYMMVSMGPGDSSDGEDDSRHGERTNQPEENQHSGAFFMNPAAFPNSVVSNNNTNETDFSDSSNTEDVDFEKLAASALSALDQEYRQTVALSPESFAKDSKDDEDLKIIAAGFDQRKEELKRIRDQGGFVVHQQWEQDESKFKGSTKEEPNKQSELDTDAVRKAVASLSMKNKDARFQQKFNDWEQRQRQHHQQQQQKTSAHVLIPPASCNVFYNHKSTLKSRQTTAKLTRSATLAEAISRLNLLSALHKGSGNDVLLIDVVGVDHVECQSAATIRSTFHPLVRWIRDYTWFSQGRDSKCAICIHFRLIGRELTRNNTAGGEIIDLLETSSKSIRATATCHTGVYHEFLENLKQQNSTQVNKIDENEWFSKRIKPDLAVAFNAGIWGYQEWATTIQYLAKWESGQEMKALPMVITAYTLDECQEDEEVISNAISTTETQASSSNDTTNGIYRSKLLWESERNPFGSQVVRETKGSTQEYRENACWQAWLLGGESS